MFSNPIVAISIEKILLIALLGLFTVWSLVVLWQRRKLYIYSWNVPGPLALPFIGSAYMFIGHTSDILDILLELQRKYDYFSKWWLGPTLFYYIPDPLHIEKVLTSQKCLDKGYMYKFLNNFFGTGLLTAPVGKWKKHRRTILPAFNQKILDSFVNIFSKQSIIFADKLKQVLGQQNSDLGLDISKCTLDTICETAMGVKLHCQTTENEFGINLDKIFEFMVRRISKLWNHLDFVWILNPQRWEQQKCIKYCQNFVLSIITKKIKAQEEQFKVQSLEPEIEEGPKAKKAFLDLLLETAQFTQEELKEQVQTFMVGGTDTTTSALSSLFTMLGMHQDVQEMVYQEMVDILGPDRAVEPSDLGQMKYTERVIKETLRLFPIAPFLSRKVEEDLDLGDAVLPAGSFVFIGILHLHRNPKYWHDPLKFDPDRFLPAEVKKRQPCTYIPFSYGPRNCIGGRYAMMNMKTIVSNVIRKYKLFTDYKTVEEVELKTNIMLRIKDGTKLSLKLR